jgi:hypothetical protein
MFGVASLTAKFFVVLQIEDTMGIGNLPTCFKNVLASVPLIGEGDQSGARLSARLEQIRSCSTRWPRWCRFAKQNDVIVGHPHVTPANAERVIAEGYRWPGCALRRAALRRWENARTADRPLSPSTEFNIKGEHLWKSTLLQ